MAQAPEAGDPMLIGMEEGENSDTEKEEEDSKAIVKEEAEEAPNWARPMAPSPVPSRPSLPSPRTPTSRTPSTPPTWRSPRWWLELAMALRTSATRAPRPWPGILLVVPGS